ncbi:MAG: hypothetical protein JNJ65_09845 [Cyclobacteriaceae bacterium]|nr:hypothetical protein [Cyclobacteriaceae bacterium]
MQKSIPYLFCLWVGSLPLLSHAQTTLGDRNSDESEIRASKSARTHQASKRQKILLKKAKVKHTAQYEFYARVEEVAREKQRILKKMAAPQYANPLYFGHKRPPKRNPVYKMKYCKECGIRH